MNKPFSKISIKLSTLALAILLSMGGWSQEENLPVFFEEIEDERVRIDSLLALSSRITYTDSNISINAIQQAKVQAQEIRDDSLLSKTYHQRGNIHYAFGEYKEALLNYHMALQLGEASSNQMCIARSSGNIGLIYETLGNYQKALQYQLVSMDAEKQQNNQSGLAGSYNNIGNVYYEIAAMDTALGYYKKALAIYYSLEDHQGIAFALNNIGSVFKANEQYDKALLYFNSALLENSNLNNMVGQSSVLSNIASIYLEQGMYDKAYESLSQSKELDFKTHDNWGLAFNYLNLARYQLTRKNYSAAQQAVDSAFFLIENNQLKDLEIDAYLFKSELASKEQKLSLSIDFLKKHNLLKDSVISKGLNDRIEQYHFDQTVETYIKGNANLKQIADEKSGIAQKRRNINYLIIGNILLLILSASLFFVNTRKRKKKRSLLEQRSIEIEQINSQLKDFNEELESRVAERTIALQQEIEERKKADIDLKAGLAKAEEANFLKNAFLANISHEIRTPLNGILGFSSLLETELALIEDESLYEYADSISQSGDRLLHLLNDIIDISRIDANDLEINKVNCSLRAIVNTKVEQYEPRAKEKGLKIIKTDQEIKSIDADPEIVSRIVTVIIDNAVKFTNKGFIKIHYEEPTDEALVLLSIKDTGIGIDKTFLSQVFEAFRQESLGYSTTYQGAGLGLPLSKKMIELLGGRIEIKSDKGSGTVVHLYFPVAKERVETAPSLQAEESITIIEASPKVGIREEEKPEAIVSPSQTAEKAGKDEPKPDLPWEGRHVLVVEDDRMNQILFKKMLAKAKVVVIATDGNNALKHVGEILKKKITPDFVLMDINLPAPWDGISLMSDIKKKWPEFEKIPFIAQTAYAMAGDKDKMLQSGFNEYVSKPIMKKELVRAIEKVLAGTS